MFKKSLLAVFAIFTSSTAFAASPYSGTMVSPPVFSGKGDTTTTRLTFDCKEDIGQFDLCVDLSAKVNTSGQVYRMGTSIHPKLAYKARTILQRVVFITADDREARSVRIMCPNNGCDMWTIVYANVEIVATRISRDGGNTWSTLNIQQRVY